MAGAAATVLFGQQGLIQQEFNPLGKAGVVLGIRRAFHQRMIRIKLKDIFHFRHCLARRGE